MTTRIDQLRDAFRRNTEDAYQELMDNEDVSVLVDWGEADEAIVQYCESILRTGQLTAEVVHADNALGFAMYITYGDRRVEVPLTEGVADRHITLHTLNQLLAPDYEIRYAVASNGMDTGSFVPLTREEWTQLEQQFPDGVRENFMPIHESPNLFTDVVRLPKSSKKKWWQFWK